MKKVTAAQVCYGASALLAAVGIWGGIRAAVVNCTIGSCAVWGMTVALPLLGASALLLISRLLPGKGA